MRFDEPVRGTYFEPGMLALDGLHRAEAIRRGDRRPPISYLLGITIDGLGPGWARCSMPLTGWLLSPQGRVPLGALAPLADVGFGLAITEHLPAGVTFTTAELSLQRLVPIRAGGRLVADGRALHFGPSMAYSEVAIRDDAGTLVAHGTSRITVFPPLHPLPDPPSEPAEPHQQPAWPTPHPYERPPAGTVLDGDLWSTMSGLEVLAAQAAGELPLPPVAELFDVALVEVEEGRTVLRVAMSEWLNSPARTVQGGITALLADAAVQTAIQTVSPAGHRFAPLDVKVNYLRPILATDTVTATASLRRRGRTIAIAEAELVNQAGKTVAIATGSGQFDAEELL